MFMFTVMTSRLLSTAESQSQTGRMFSAQIERDCSKILSIIDNLHPPSPSSIIINFVIITLAGGI